MTDTPDQKPIGRPRKSEADRKEGNLTFRTRRGLRERLTAVAAKSGRSLSEEVERRVEESFLVEDAHESIAAAALKVAASAVEEANRNVDAQYVDFFGGRDGFNIAKTSSEVYRESLTRVCREFDVTDIRTISDYGIAKLKQYMRDGQDRVVDEWANYVFLARLLSNVSFDDLSKGFEKGMEAAGADPEIREKMNAQYERLFSKNSTKNEDN